MVDRARFATLALALGLLTLAFGLLPVLLRPMEKTTAPGSKPSRPNPPAPRPVVTPTSKSISPSEPGSDPQIPGSCYCNSVKTIIFDLPGGVIANPHAAAICNSQQFGLDECPADSQMGVVEPTVVFDTGTIQTGYTPLYNLEPQPGQAGLLGFKTFLFNFPIYQVISARTDGDYGLRSETTGITQMFALAGFKQWMWGVPASPANDALRFKHGGSFPSGNPTHPTCRKSRTSQLRQPAPGRSNRK